MEIKCVCDSSFKKYGRVIKGYDWAPLLDAMNQYTPIPADVAYVPSVRELEAVESTKKILEDEVFGELPIEIGYCNGNPDGFRCVIVLPKGTNVDLEKKIARTGENALLTANNKWRICHKDSGITDEGAYFGMIGENITLEH